MLPRILEVEVMDTAEEARDYDAMDHAAVNRVFVADFLAVWNGANPILDVSAGTAQIPIELCRQSAAAQVVAIDLAEQMLAVGRDNVRRAGFADRLRLERIDAKRMPYPAGLFGALISNSIIHHIPEPAAVFAEMQRVVTPGGTLFVRDLLRPGDEATLAHLVERYAEGANEHQKQMFADSLHAALTLVDVQGIVGALGIRSGRRAANHGPTLDVDGHEMTEANWLSKQPGIVPKPSRLRSRSTHPQMLLQQTSIHHHRQSRRPGLVGGGVVDDAFLHPHRLRTDGDRCVDDLRHRVRLAKDVHHIDPFWNVL